MVYYYIPPNGNGESPGVYDTEPTSYMYNEVVLGWGNQQATQGACDTSGRLHGKASLVRQTSKTMFVADGLGGYVSNSIRFQNSITGCPMATVYNADYNGATIPPITLADAYLGTGGPDDKAGDNESFDLHRHRGKINIGFCDGHVETRNISVSDLSSVYLMAP